MQLATRYRSQHLGWNVKHFHAGYRREGGVRSYSWVKDRLQEAGLVSRAAGRGKHRKRQERAPLPGMMLHPDGSTHPWVSGRRWDLIVTMDDATNEHYSMFFVLYLPEALCPCNPGLSRRRARPRAFGACGR